MSRLFCSRWDTNTDGGKDTEKIFCTVLSWSPMRSYISHFCKSFLFITVLCFDCTTISIERITHGILYN